MSEELDAKQEAPPLSLVQYALSCAGEFRLNLKRLLAGVDTLCAGEAEASPDYLQELRRLSRALRLETGITMPEPVARPALQNSGVPVVAPEFISSINLTKKQIACARGVMVELAGFGAFLDCFLICPAGCVILISGVRWARIWPDTMSVHHQQGEQENLLALLDTDADNVVQVAELLKVTATFNTAEGVRPLFITPGWKGCPHHYLLLAYATTAVEYAFFESLLCFWPAKQRGSILHLDDSGAQWRLPEQVLTRLAADAPSLNVPLLLRMLREIEESHAAERAAASPP